MVLIVNGTKIRFFLEMTTSFYRFLFLSLQFDTFMGLLLVLLVFVYRFNYGVP